ncbi:MAG: hypothetical protein WBV94_14200 [Blastocatellia bacterium]
MLNRAIKMMHLLTSQSFLLRSYHSATRMQKISIRSLVITWACLFFITQTIDSSIAPTITVVSAGTDIPNVSFADQLLSSEADSTLKSATVIVILKNTGTIPAMLNFSMTLKDASADVTILDNPNRIEPSELKVFHLKITLKEGNAPASGYLRVRPSSIDMTPATTGVMSEIQFSIIAPALILPPPSPFIFWLTLIASLIIISLSYIKLKSKAGIKLEDPMGKAEWNINSWITNITAASSGFTFLITATLLKNKAYYFSKTGYEITALLFAILILLGPPVYNFACKPVETKLPNGQVKYQFQGNVLSFLCACTLTIWAVLGQLVIFILIIDEMFKAEIIHESVARLLELLFIVVIVLVSGYTYRTIYQTVIDQKIQQEAINKKLETIELESVTAESLTLPTWQIL